MKIEGMPMFEENAPSFEDYVLFEEIIVNFEFEEVFEGKASDVERVKGGIKYRGEIFPGFNKPKKYSGKGKFKKRVLAKEGDEIKVLNFGHIDYEDYTQHKDAERRKNFRSRMQCDKGKLSKLTKRYWACQNLW